MKEKVFDSKYIHCFEWKEHKIFEIVWLPNSENIEYSEILDITEKMLENIQLHYVLSDTRDMGFAVVPNLQIEYGKYSTRKFIEKGCKKLAILLPEAFVVNLGVQQLVDEVDEMKFENMFKIKYCSSYDEAQKWLTFNQSL